MFRDTYWNIHFFFAGGWNANPSASVFASAFRGILFRCGITPSTTANVRPQDGTDLLREETLHEHEEDNNDDQDEHPLSLSPFLDNVVEYISGWVARHLQTRIKCMDCALSLTSETPLLTGNRLINIKDRGGLMIPSISLQNVCKACEVFFKSKKEKKMKFIQIVVEHLIGLDIFATLNQHHLDTLDGVDSHITSLIRLIISTYYDLRQHHACKLRNLELHRRRMRGTYTHLLHHHYHQ